MRSTRASMLGIILSAKQGSVGCARLLTLALHTPQRVRHGDKVQSSLGIDSLLAPLGQDESRRVLKEAVHILPSSSLKALARDLEERATEVKDVDGCAESQPRSSRTARAGLLTIKLGNWEVL